jgi:hypothetical protein
VQTHRVPSALSAGASAAGAVHVIEQGPCAWSAWGRRPAGRLLSPFVTPEQPAGGSNRMQAGQARAW